MSNKIIHLFAAISSALLLISCQSHAQPQSTGGQDGPVTARTQAPFDISGNWVSVVTEDWRFRMLTAQAGDYEGVPLSQAGQERANDWNPPVEVRGNECKAYGVGGLLRMPARLQIDWQNDNVLRIRTDAGQQTRLLKFGEAQDGAGAGSLQGVSNASWALQRAGGFGSEIVDGTLNVHTTDMSEGYFRRNGVPYSEQSTITEHFELLRHGDDEYLVVIARLNDPVYMTSEVITSTNFKREADSSGWNPLPCDQDVE